MLSISHCSSKESIIMAEDESAESERQVKMGNQIVQLEVRGTPYEVSRTLLEADPNTMLARLVSERLEEDPKQVIFIDRDGDLFRYVLDYMRDKEVHLPPGVSKAAVMKELDYFGFQNVTNVHGYKTVAPTIASQVTDAEYKYRAKLERLDSRARELEKKKMYEMIAFQCFQAYSETGRLEDIPFHAGGPPFKGTITECRHVPAGICTSCYKFISPIWLFGDGELQDEIRYSQNLDTYLLDGCLVKYGLECRGGGGRTINLALLDDDDIVDDDSSDY